MVQPEYDGIRPELSLAAGQVAFQLRKEQPSVDPFIFARGLQALGNYAKHVENSQSWKSFLRKQAEELVRWLASEAKTIMASTDLYVGLDARLKNYMQSLATLSEFARSGLAPGPSSQMVSALERLVIAADTYAGSIDDSAVFAAIVEGSVEYDIQRLGGTKLAARTADRLIHGALAREPQTEMLGMVGLALGTTLGSIITREWKRLAPKFDSKYGHGSVDDDLRVLLRAVVRQLENGQQGLGALALAAQKLGENAVAETLELRALAELREKLPFAGDEGLGLVIDLIRPLSRSRRARAVVFAGGELSNIEEAIKDKALLSSQKAHVVSDGRLRVYQSVPIVLVGVLASVIAHDLDAGATWYVGVAISVTLAAVAVWTRKSP